MTEWTREQEWFLASPDFDEDEFHRRWPKAHTGEAIARRRRRPLPEYRPHPTDVRIQWDKKEGDVHWRDFLEPIAQMRSLYQKASSSQDFAHITVETDDVLPIMLIADWHIGSWGVDHYQIAMMTDIIQKLGIKIGVMGDMCEQAIRQRSVIEASGNLLTPYQQHQFLDSWITDLSDLILWSTWDNHAVVRQEELVGYSDYSELFKKKTIYHTGIGHIDLTVGDQTYKLAVSHKFTGNSATNPINGQKTYMLREGIDREIAIGGDTHRPAMQYYADGPMHRCAINCGSAQKDSGYAKRYFTLYTHCWMPVIELHPKYHLMHAYPTFLHYCFFSKGIDVKEIMGEGWGREFLF